MQGQELGPYTILEPLGAGGMGEVWLAEDTRLGRRVAIKVLPEQFASDPERLARFEQEARAAAALNHPNIAAVHDVGVEDGTHFIVQEYLTGKSLRDALESGPLALKRTLALATEIAEALRAAHKAGIVHRDLKPDNVFVTEDGHAKVLDFGLAKLTEGAAAPPGTKSMSPTALGTQQGAIMGTAGYMAPEQVAGREVDARADLFAFGCVLYEMASGKQPFRGQNIHETMEKIVSSEPEALSPGTAPPEMQRLVRKCLAKDRAERAQSAGDLVVDLKLLARDVESGTAAYAPVGPADAAASARRTPSGIAVAAVAAVSLLLGALGVWIIRDEPAADELVTELGIDLAGSRLDTNFGPGAMLSPSGRLVAMAVLRRELDRFRIEVGGSGDDADGLYLRSLDGGVPELLVSRPVDNPVFSPDSQWIAYEQDGVLWKIPVTGGTPLRLAEAPSDRGTAWLSDGSILLVPTAADGIFRIPPDGGQVVPVTTLGDGEAAHRWQQVLPGETHVLFSVAADGFDWTDATIEVADLASGERKVIARGGYYPRYVSSGHVLYANGSALFGLPFDLDRLEATGPPFRALDGLASNSTVGSAQFSLSDDGTLLYLPVSVGNAPLSMRLIARDRDGEITTLGSERADLDIPGVAMSPSLSPDGRRLAYVQANSGGDGDIWIHDIERALSSRLTLSPRLEWFPVWSRDGRHVYYVLSAGNAEEAGLYRRNADGTGDAERILADPDWQIWDQHPDGRLIGGRFLAPGRGGTPIEALDLQSGGEPVVLVESDAGNLQAKVSPDGRWLAYVSDESERMEVYVHGMETGGRWQISDQGGAQPLFSGDGREIYYRSGRSIMAVAIDPDGDALQPGRPHLLYDSVEGLTRGISMSGTFQYDYTTVDGQLFVEAVDLTRIDSPEHRGVLVFNWLERLRRLAAEQD